MCTDYAADGMPGLAKKTNDPPPFHGPLRAFPGVFRGLGGYILSGVDRRRRSNQNER